MRAARSTRIGSALLTSLLCIPLARASDDLPVVLSWTAPATGGCPDAAYVFGELRRYVGDAASGSQRARIEASADIRSVEGEGWKLVLKTKQGEGESERVFRDASCTAVADAAVVVLAWMLDPSAMASRALPAAVQRTQSAAPVAVRSEPTPPKQLHQTGVRALLGLGLVGDLGSLPVAAFGAEARGGARLTPIRLQAYGAYWLSVRKVSATLAGGDAAGATFAFRALGFETCWDGLPKSAGPRLGLGVCVGPELDVVRGAGFGVNAPAQASKRWLALTGSLEGTTSLTVGVRLFMRVGALLPTEREHFALQGVGEVYRPAALAGRASVGLELEL